MGNWVDIPTDNIGILFRTYGGTDYYVRAELNGSAAAFVLEGSRYRELLISVGTTNPEWQYRGSGSWSYMRGNIYQTSHYGQSCWEYQYLEEGGSVPASIFTPYNSVDEAISDYFSYLAHHITYRPTNCSFPNAPTEAAVGSTVTVPVAFEEGYTLVNPSEIYVTCNGVSVPSTYSNGILTFTMPDPT